ncbi:MAG: hypothetical protein WC969_00915 [Elusimicrobiota bacterium]|jgi:hypothetical protein
MRVRFAAAAAFLALGTASAAAATPMEWLADPVRLDPDMLEVWIPPMQSAAVADEGIVVSPEDTQEIGRRVWKNECGGTVEGLTHWNKGESFASLGIGHFIWYPAGQEGPFEESFPKLLSFLRSEGASVPAWLVDGLDCPWADREAFFSDLQSSRMRELRALLADTVALQARFIVMRLEASLPKILAVLPYEERAAVRERFYLVASGGLGVYALVDYVNFKGEGVNPTERYKGQGWGLLQVLQGLAEEPSLPANALFADSAARTLERRVRNSPPERNEARWLPGWLKRLDTYRR